MEKGKKNRRFNSIARILLRGVIFATVVRSTGTKKACHA